MLALWLVSGLAGCKLPDEGGPQVEPGLAYIDAKTALLRAADDSDSATRLHAIEALASTLGVEAGDLFREALSDQNPAIRFAAALAVGEARYEPAKPGLAAMAANKEVEPDKRVFCAVIYALYALGDDTYAGELATLLFDREREVRMDAALAMGRMGEPSAAEPLKALLRNERDEGVKIQLLESLALLHDSWSAEVLEAYTKGYFLDLRLVAIPALGRAGGVRAPRVLKDLTHPRHPVRVRVVAAGELARLGHGQPELYELCARSVRQPEQVLADAAKRSRKLTDTDAASLRRLAAISLGWMKDERAVNVLYPLLKCPDGGARVAGAMSILRLLKHYRVQATTLAAPGPTPPPPPAATQPAPPKPKPPPPRKKPKLHTAGGKD